MAKKIYAFLIVFLFSSCSETYENGEYKSFSNMLNQCKGTTIVVGIGEVDGSFRSAKINITVVDCAQRFYSCRIGGDLGLNIGDTVKK